MHRLRRLTGWILVCLMLVVAACGKASHETDASSAHLSPARIAVIVADHVDREPLTVSRWDVMSRELDVDAPGAEIRYPGGHFLGVAVAPTTDSALLCTKAGFFDKCEGIVHRGAHLVLGWQEAEPEEDPGVVYVIAHRDGEDVIADYSGTRITGDPRGLELGVTIEEMADTVTDHRLTLR